MADQFVPGGSGGGGDVDLADYEGDVSLKSPNLIYILGGDTDSGVIISNLAAYDDDPEGTYNGINWYTNGVDGEQSFQALAGSILLQAPDDGSTLTFDAGGFLLDIDSGSIQLITTSQINLIAGDGETVNITDVNAWADSGNGIGWYAGAGDGDAAQGLAVYVGVGAAHNLKFLGDGVLLVDDAPVALADLTVSGKGFVNHGATAGAARPTEYASIEWYGSVEPTNAVDGDTWVDTSA